MDWCVNPDLVPWLMFSPIAAMLGVLAWTIITRVQDECSCVDHRFVYFCARCGRSDG
jgi:hypothetical protein